MVRAAICREFGAPLEIEEIRLRPPRPDEVLVDVAACAICHSDISYAAGEWGGALPAIYGHEAAGVVRQAGAEAGDFRPGMRVIATLIRHCGHCAPCQQGHHVLCRTDAGDGTGAITTADGETVTKAMHCGAFAEQILVHHSQLLEIPDDLPFDEASLLACGAITAYGAVFNVAQMRPGQSAVVIGCGGVGLNTVQAACIAGADPRIAVDISDRKLASARGFGATATVNSATQDLAEEIRRLTGGWGADVILVTVGAKSAFDGALEALAPGGTLVVVGMPPSGVLAQYEPANLAGSNQRILGSKMGDAQIHRDIPLILAAWRRGAFQLAPLISKRYRLDQINEAIDSVVRGEALRNVILFEGIANA